ncbi:DUF2867 domain-containing protein [Pelagibacterium halotolerans]|uniref:DUF2867 domain-containing protein n=1 Tax=Pelagibacterium halotolerans TaxID=531813 RepID=UPI00384E3F0A
MPKAFRYPQTGALMRHYTEGDFLDCQIARVPEPSLSAADLALMTVFAMPRWVMVLLAIRNALVKPFGLKTGTEQGYAPPTRDDILERRYTGAFAVDHVSSEEVTFGSDDRHMDFRISVIKTRAPMGYVALATWVHPHNIWGRLYLWGVLPFHKLIVWRMLANLRDDVERGR